MESEDSASEEDVYMKLLPNKGEVPDYESAGDLDGTLSGSEEFEDVMPEDEDEQWELRWKHMEVKQKKFLFEKLDFQLNADFLFPLNSFTLCSDHLHKQSKEALKEFRNFNRKLFLCLLQ